MGRDIHLLFIVDRERRDHAGLGKGSDLYFKRNGLEPFLKRKIIAQGLQVRVPAKMVKVRETQPDCPLQGGQGLGSIARKDVAAGKIIMNDRVILAKKGQPFIDLKAFFKKTTARIGLRERGEGINVVGTMLQDAFEKRYFEIQVVRFHESMIPYLATFSIYF